MSARIRSLLYFGLAAVAALAGAMLTGRYRESATLAYGELRPALVSTAPLPAGKALTLTQVEAATEPRRVPERFLPTGAVTRSETLVGLAPSFDLPPGTYLTAAMVQPPKLPRRSGLRLGGGRSPVEIRVTGATAMRSTQAGPGKVPRVDVVVTGEPAVGGGPGRTWVAATGVPLLSQPSVAADAEASGLSPVILGLTRRQALRLIHAESFARSLRLLPRPP